MSTSHFLLSLVPNEVIRLKDVRSDVVQVSSYSPVRVSFSKVNGNLHIQIFPYDNEDGIL